MPKGIYKRKPKATKYAPGTIHDTPQGKIKVLDYIRATNSKRPRAIILCLETGYVANVQCTNIATGKFRDYRKRSVYGVGYLGTKMHIPSRSSGSIIRRLYDLWANMLKRAYGGYDPSYDDVTVEPAWHSFEKFMKTIINVSGYAEWERNDEPMVLDKDIRVPGSRIYSRETCMFVTPQENTSDASKRRWASVNA